MSPNEAIKNLTDHTPKSPPYFDPPFVMALKLGTEALKAILRMRQDNAFLSPRLLPGETKE